MSGTPELMPAAWVIPGLEAQDDGFIDAMAWQSGEFTVPLYPARRPISKETIHAALAAFQSGDLDWGEQDEVLMRLALIAADSTR